MGGLAAKQNKKATNVQMAYIFACLEEMGHPTFINPKDPCAARSAFIAELIQKPKDFKVHGKSNRVCTSIARESSIFMHLFEGSKLGILDLYAPMEVWSQVRGLWSDLAFHPKTTASRT